jgi:hypothetical protein
LASQHAEGREEAWQGWRPSPCTLQAAYGVTTRKCSECPVRMNIRRTYAASIDGFSRSGRKTLAIRALVGAYTCHSWARKRGYVSGSTPTV